MRSLIIAVLCAGIVVGGFVLAKRFVGSPLPRELTFAVGRSTGRYADFARELKRRFEAKTGLTLQIVETAGLAENLDLVTMAEGGADLALVLGSAIKPIVQERKEGTKAVELTNLGAVFFEPIWVFVRVGSAPLEDVGDLKGKRIAIGEPDSPERTIALSILGAHGILPDNPATGRFVDLGGKEAGIALAKAEIDAAFFVAGIGSEILKVLFEAEGLAMLELRQAAAYKTVCPSLAPVLIGEGLVDLALQMPPADMQTVAEAISIVGKSTIPRQLIPILLAESQAILSGGSVLEKPGELPSPGFSALPIADEAAHFYRTGLSSSVLYRLLPLRLASAVERYWIFALPLVFLAVPFFLLLPPLWRWEWRSQITKHYKHLRDVDRRVAAQDPTLHPAEEINNLQKLRAALLTLRTPLAYADRLYNLQLHLNLVINRLKLMVPRETPGQTRDE